MNHGVDDPFMVIGKICVAARTKGAKYLEQCMCAGDVIEDDLVQRYQVVLNRASCNVDGNQRTKFRMYVSTNPNGTVHPMYVRTAVSILDRNRACATRLRLSSHSLAIETGRWSRIPRDKRLCSCGAVQTEEHVICFRPVSQHVRSQSEFVAVEFTNIVNFFDCADVYLVCRICSLILSSYD